MSTFAVPVLLDFEDHEGMESVSGTLIPEVAKLSDDYLSSYGVAFESGSPFAAVVTLGCGHAPSGVKGMGGSKVWM